MLTRTQGVNTSVLPTLVDEVSWQHPGPNPQGKCKGCRFAWPCPASRLADSVESLLSFKRRPVVAGKGASPDPEVSPVRLDNARVLVTGGAGFIGGHVVNELLSHTPNIAVLDDFSAGTQDNLDAARSRGLVENNVFTADVRSADVDRIVAAWRPTIVVHLAAQSKVARSISDPVTDVTVNVGGTVNVLDTAARHNVERVVIASSGGTIYGQAGIGGALIAESVRDASPSPYGTGKAAADDYLRLFCELYGLRGTSLAFGNVYGPDAAGTPGKRRCLLVRSACLGE